MTEIDGILKGLGTLTGVIGTIVMNTNGLPIRTTFKDAEAVHYCALISEFLRKAKTVIEPLMGGSPIDVIRIRSQKNEIIIAPSDPKRVEDPKDKRDASSKEDSKKESDVNIILVVVQDATVQA
jgi:dynein light chain roadblock-type